MCIVVGLWVFLKGVHGRVYFFPCIFILVYALVRVSIPTQTSWPRSKLGRKGFILPILPHCCSSPKDFRTGTQASQETGGDAEAMERCYLLACSAFFLIEPKAISPGMVPPTRGPPPLITNWENALQLDLMDAPNMRPQPSQQIWGHQSCKGNAPSPYTGRGHDRSPLTEVPKGLEI